MTRTTTFTLLLCVVTATNAGGQPPGEAPDLRPAEMGLSSDKLQRITDYLQGEVDEGRIAGAVAAVSRHGRVGYLGAVGYRDHVTQQPMQSDSLFRIASMTKAITSAAIMSLIEDGSLSLDDPLAKHLPSFTKLRVLKTVDGVSTDTVPADRQPSIRDLLVHRSGLTYGWFGPGKLDAIYAQNGIQNLFEPTDETIGDRIERLASVPLKSQPGTAWDYSISTDVLGRVVEVVSGLTLDQFFRERFFRPLRMKDTFFYVPEHKQSRLASLFTVDDTKRLQPVLDSPMQAGFLRFSADYCTKPGRFYSGGGGLVSSAPDYLRFLHMLLRGGELEGVRVLERDTVALMTKNHIGDLTIPFPGHGDGFGFGFGVVTDRGADKDGFSVGSFSWGGIFNTYFWVDPQEELVGVLMTQVFPNDHLAVREGFRQRAYAAIDDSGFEQLYHYLPGNENANPHFSARQLRVNAAEVSVHPSFASRSEARSSGMARIRVDEDLRSIRRVDLDTEIWGGHPGTMNKRVTINGRSTQSFPEVGASQHHCTHQAPSFNLRPIDLVNGYNSIQFACDTGDTFWGHYIVDRATLRVGLHNEDERLVESGLSEFRARVTVTPLAGMEEGFGLSLDVGKESLNSIANVHYQARYFGYDEDGNCWRTDWHHLEGPTFDTSMLPAQEHVEVRALVEFNEYANLHYRTPSAKGLVIEAREAERVQLFSSHDLPTPFWSRDDRVKECTIHLDLDPQNITSAELHVVAWTGGAGKVADYFTLNGKHLAVAEGEGHNTVYSRVEIEPSLLRRGENKIVLRSDTKHHGIEVLLPGPALMVRYRVDEAVKPPKAEAVRVETARDESAGGLDCYRITTPTATYYLDKVGAGLSSMIDCDGNDWLGFHPKPGSGAAGEYRGFPNAVFKEAGSFFHARNSGTDPCETRIEESSPDRVVISAVAVNGKWAGSYTFTRESCTFTMTKKPEGHNYWVLYEGTPGGQYDDSDWWMTPTDSLQHPLTDRYDGDLSGNSSSGEWIAFGDKNLSRMLVLSHQEDDPHLDQFYQMQGKMTVFGFGRAGMKKFLSTVPQSFSIGFVESTEYAAAKEFAAAATPATALAQPTHKTKSSEDAKSSVASEVYLRSFEQFALTHKGDAKAGARLMHDQRTKCVVCHSVGAEGGQVGPISPALAANTIGRT